MVSKILKEQDPNSSNLTTNQNDLDDEGSEFIIQVLHQEVLFDGNISTISFFRDITYSMQYEQILDQEKRSKVIETALQDHLLHLVKRFQVGF